MCGFLDFCLGKRIRRRRRVLDFESPSFLERCQGRRILAPRQVEPAGTGLGWLREPSAYCSAYTHPTNGWGPASLDDGLEGYAKRIS